MSVLPDKKVRYDSQLRQLAEHGFHEEEATRWARIPLTWHPILLKTGVHHEAHT
jgi:hypothetical protein